MSTTPLKITRKELLLSSAALTAAFFASKLGPALAGSKKDKYTAEKQKDILKVQESAEKQIYDVLTPEQKAIQKEALKRGDEKPDVKLTDTQKAQIKKIRLEANKQVSAILGLQ